MDITAAKVPTRGAIFLGVAAAASGLIAFALLAPRWLLILEHLRVSVESLQGFVALMLACLLLITWSAEQCGDHTLWTSSGLIGMGLLDGFHAALPPGNTSLWLHATAVAAGGAFFALAWLPERTLTAQVADQVPKMVGAAALIFGLLSVAFPGWLPVMAQGSAVTPWARTLTSAGSLGFFAAGARFLSRERRAALGPDSWLAAICLLFGASALVAGLSAAGERAWWFWHLGSLSAYVTALGLAVTSGGGLEEPQSLNRIRKDKRPARPAAGPSGPDHREAPKDPDGRRSVGELQAVPICLESFMDILIEPLLVLDGDLKVVKASKAFYQTFQVSPDETEGRLLYELGNHQWDMPKLRELLEEVLHHGTRFEGFEVSHVFPAVGFRTMKLNARKTAGDGARTDTILLAMGNVTHRKTAEEALRKARRALEALSHCNKAMVHAQEEVDLVHEVCQTIVEKGGYSKAWVGYTEAGASPSIRLIALAENEYCKLEDICISCIEARGEEHPANEVIRSGQPIVSHGPPHEPYHKSDRPRRLLCPYSSCIALPLQNGHQAFGTLNVCAKEPDAFDEDEVALLEELSADLAYGITTLRTRTEHQRAEEELRQAHETLQKAYEKLEKAKAAAIASEKLASVGRLTAGVSHEILNPLNGIMITLHYLLSDDDMPKNLVEELEEMLVQAGRISKISQDLLSFARQRLPERRLLDLNATLTQTLGLLEHKLRLTNIVVELRLADDLPFVSADKDQIQQVLLNLLSNACDAMPGGGRLTVETAEAPALFAGTRPFVELRLRDTGHGIPPENTEKIFDPFFTTKPEGQGTGLGLSVCQGIIDNHGGTIWAENAPEGGSVFVVRLRAEENHE